MIGTMRLFLSLGGAAAAVAFATAQAPAPATPPSDPLPPCAQVDGVLQTVTSAGPRPGETRTTTYRNVGYRVLPGTAFIDRASVASWGSAAGDGLPQIGLRKTPVTDALQPNMPIVISYGGGEYAAGRIVRIVVDPATHARSVVLPKGADFPSTDKHAEEELATPSPHPRARSTSPAPQAAPSQPAPSPESEAALAQSLARAVADAGGPDALNGGSGDATNVVFCR